MHSSLKTGTLCLNIFIKYNPNKVGNLMEENELLLYFDLLITVNFVLLIKLDFVCGKLKKLQKSFHVVFYENTSTSNI